MFEAKYSVGEFTKLAGVSAGKLRDWRHRGIRFGNLIEQLETGQPVYCDYDLYEYVVAMKLSTEPTLGLHRCFEFARCITPAAAKLCGLEGVHLREDGGMNPLGAAGSTFGTHIVPDNARYSVFDLDGLDHEYSETGAGSFARGMFFELQPFADDLKHFIEVVLLARREAAD